MLRDFISRILAQLGITSVMEEIDQWLMTSHDSQGQLDLDLLQRLVSGYISAQSSLGKQGAERLVKNLFGHWEIVSNPDRLYAELQVLLAEIAAGKNPSALEGE